MSGKKGDFGFYGKGTDGYVHYKQSFDRIRKEQGGRSGPGRGQDPMGDDGAKGAKDAKDAKEDIMSAAAGCLCVLGLVVAVVAGANFLFDLLFGLIDELAYLL